MNFPGKGRQSLLTILILMLGHINKITGFSDPPASSFRLSTHFLIFRAKVKLIT